MTVDDIYKLGGVVIGVITAGLSYLVSRENKRQAQTKEMRETTQQRTDREATEIGANLAMNDSQLRYFIESLRSDREKDRAEMVRLSARIDSLETRLQAEQTTTIELRADLATANATIRDLTTQNQRQADELARLRSQIAELQGREAGEDRADQRSARAQDRQDERDTLAQDRADSREDRRDERERNRP